MIAARAVLAEDEPLLAASLRRELAIAWPELTIVAVAGDGEAALAAVLSERPDIVFLDIRMPGVDGLGVAEALAEDWPAGAEAFPLVVFVTAYEQYALAAFERAAFDYVLKPVLPDRLAATCRRLDAALHARRRTVEVPGDALAAAVDRIAALLRAAPGPAMPEPLRVLQVGVGTAIVMVPVDDVIVFEAANKYVRVLTVGREHLIRTSLRELLPRLDPGRFWQVHRGTVVRADTIERALRDETGRITLALRGRPEPIAVSRLHTARFKAM